MICHFICNACSVIRIDHLSENVFFRMSSGGPLRNQLAPYHFETHLNSNELLGTTSDAWKLQMRGLSDRRAQRLLITLFGSIMAIAIACGGGDTVEILASPVLSEITSTTTRTLIPTSSWFCYNSTSKSNIRIHGVPQQNSGVRLWRDSKSQHPTTQNLP